MRGIEVAPYHSPLAPKRDGFNCLTLDIFNYEQLLENARKDPNVRDKIDNIQPVDIVASATNIDAAVMDRDELETYDYIVSSHNFEHLPNPIKFLKACGRVLKKNGLLSMAIPNKRFTFDIARPLSSFADFYRAFHENYERPDPWTIFDFQSSFANDVPISTKTNGTPVYANSLTTTFNELIDRLSNNADQSYQDAHCWVFTPESFMSIILNCMILRLTPLSLTHVEDAGFEFYAHFRNTGPLSVENSLKLEQDRRNQTIMSFKN